MGTANFHNENASKVFACTVQHEFEYEDLIMNLESEFGKFPECSGIDNDELRSYPSKVVTAIYESKNYKGFEVFVILSVIVRSGYYDGVNLDYNIHYEVGGDATDFVNFKEILEWQLKSSKMAAYKAPLAEAWANKATEGIKAKAEEIYAMYSMPLKEVARFYTKKVIDEKGMY